MKKELDLFVIYMGTAKSIIVILQIY